MTEVLFDTSAYSALGRGHPEAASVAASADRIVVTPVVLGELLAGFRKGKRRRRNQDLLRKFLNSPRVDVLPVDAETAERYAAIVDSLRAAGKSIPTNDLWIASSAMQHGLALVTADAHFNDVPQILVHPLLPV